MPLASVLLAMLLAFAIGGRKIDATTSFHGLTVRQAFNPARGVRHTLETIPEELIFGNLGVSVSLEPSHAAALLCGLALAWAWTRRGRGPAHR